MGGYKSWFGVVTSGYAWLWVVRGGNGMVTVGFGVVMGGYGWSQVVTGGYGVVTGGYGWLYW